VIRASVVTVVWDKVPGATGYDIYRNGVKVSSTRTALTARLGVPMGATVFVVKAKGVTTGAAETITLRQHQ
jgi:hypothetical protein